MAAPEGVAPRADEAGSGLGRRTIALALAGFLVLAFLIHAEALDGPFMADDYLLIQTNPLVQVGGLRATREAFRATGAARRYAGGNYAPFLHMSHAVQWRLFGSETRGYHLTNVVLHATNATLLAALLGATGVPTLGALSAGALFVAHPAHVEAVAWISQLRTLAALGLALGAVGFFLRGSWLCLPLLGAALLFKASAAAILPMVAWLYVTRVRSGTTRPRQGWWLAGLVGVFVLYAPFQLFGFATLAEAPFDPYPDVATHIASITAIGARYLAMAAAGVGLAAYHEPSVVTSVADPWFLAGAALTVALLVRIGIALRAGSDEAAWWLSAAAAFVPISQIIPFLWGMGDRYLYPILPGLLGGGALALVALQSRLAAGPARALGVVAVAASLALATAFALQSRARTQIWQHHDRLYADAAAAYPDGGVAHYRHTLDALREDDRDRALSHLEQAIARGIHFVQNVPADRRLARLHDEPGYVALREEIARSVIRNRRSRTPLNAEDLSEIANQHNVLGEHQQALEALEEAMRIAGPLRPQIFTQLTRTKGMLREAQRGE